MQKRDGTLIADPPRGWEMFAFIGPGIVWTGMAIGGGELVLNPRVGAVWGMMTLWMPIMAVMLKWFMTVEIGRWSIYTGTSIREGFALLPGPSKWLNWIILPVGIFLGAVHIGGLVAMIGYVTKELLPILPAYVWSILIMVSYVALTWNGRYSLIEKVMMGCVAIMTLSTIAVSIKLFPGFGAIMEGFTFQIPTSTPEWAVKNFKISANPLIEILPAMAFAGAGAINGLWYSDWLLAKGFGYNAKYELGSSRVEALAELKNLDSGEVEKLHGWRRVMIHDSWWGANLATIVVLAAFIINAIVVLHPLQLAPGGVGFIGTLTKTFTQTLGEWAKYLYLTGALAVIYSTMATLYDGYARLIDNSIKICMPNWRSYLSISIVWRYRIWFLYGTIGNFFLVYLFNAVPVKFLQAAAWVEGVYMLPIVAFAVAYLTYFKLPSFFDKSVQDQVRPSPIFTLGTIAAGLFYAGMIVYAFTM